MPACLHVRGVVGAVNKASTSKESWTSDGVAIARTGSMMPPVWSAGAAPPCTANSGQLGESTGYEASLNPVRTAVVMVRFPSTVIDTAGVAPYSWTA